MDTNIVRDITDIYFEHIVESSHLETDMKKRRKDNEKAVEDMKKTKAHRDMVDTIRKKFDEEFVDPEHGEAPSGRSPLQNVSDHPKASVRKKAVKGFRKQMEKEYGGKWKSRSNDPVDEGVVADRAKSAVDNQRLDDEQSDTQKSVNKLKKGNKKVTRASASIAASKSERTARGMHPKAGQTGAYRIEALDPVGKEDDDVDNDGKKNTKSDKYLLNRRKAVGKAIATQEAKEVKRWWDDDGDGKGYEEGEVSGKFKKKKKIKEGFSNWREDLIEVADKIIKNKSEDVKIVEKEVNNKIDINPKLDLGEVAQNLGGSLLEMVKIEDFEGVLDELTESEMFLLNDNLIEKIVEEVFVECIEEGYNLSDIENTLLESLEISSFILNEETDIDTTIKEGRLEKVKSAVKSVAKGLARGVGYAAGAAVRAVKGAGREMKSGYKRGRQGSSSSSSSGSSESGESKESGETKKPGLLSRIGSKLKSGLRRVIHRGASAVEKTAGKVARRTAEGEKKEAPKAAPKKAEKAEDPWAGSATTPPKAKAKTNKKAKSTNPAAKGAAKERKNVNSSAKPQTTHQRKKRTSKLDSLLASVRADESVNLVGEKVVNPYAVGMAAAMKSTGDKPPLKKSTITKAHKIAKKVETREEAIREALHVKMIEKIEEQFGI